MVGYSVVSFLASRFGRKPAILLVLGISIAGDVFLISSSAFNPLIELVLAILWVICLSLTNPLILAYVVNLYIIDLVDAEERCVVCVVFASRIAQGLTLSQNIIIKLLIWLGVPRYVAEIPSFADF